MKNLLCVIPFLVASASGASPDWNTAAAQHLLESGGVHLQAGRTLEAETDFREATRLLEGSPETDPAQLALALNNLATTLAMRGESVRAIPVLRRAMFLAGTGHPARAELAGNLARVLLDSGSMAEAESLIETSIEAAREHRSAYQAYPLAMRAQVRADHGLWDRAEADIAQALRFAATLEPQGGPLTADLRRIECTIRQRVRPGQRRRLHRKSGACQ